MIKRISQKYPYGNVELTVESYSVFISFQVNAVVSLKCQKWPTLTCVYYTLTFFECQEHKRNKCCININILLREPAQAANERGAGAGRYQHAVLLTQGSGTKPKPKAVLYHASCSSWSPRDSAAPAVPWARPRWHSSSWRVVLEQSEREGLPHFCPELLNCPLMGFVPCQAGSSWKNKNRSSLSELENYPHY